MFLEAETVLPTCKDLISYLNVELMIANYNKYKVHFIGSRYWFMET